VVTGTESPRRKLALAASIFERCGGFAQVSKIVMSFYDRVLDSDLLAPYFAETDMRTLVDHQTKFIAFLMGGPASYTDETLKRVHRHLDITEEAFEEMATLLEETLEDFELSDGDVASVIEEIRRREPLIVTS
jgi:hemoglobin